LAEILLNLEVKPGTPCGCKCSDKEPYKLNLQNIGLLNEDMLGKLQVCMS